jgi:hypothetical protein
VVGCILIMLFSFLQIMFTIIGVNIYDVRIHFESTDGGS